MGSQSDYKTMKIVEKILKKMSVSFETKIISVIELPRGCMNMLDPLKEIILVL